MKLPASRLLLPRLLLLMVALLALAAALACTQPETAAPEEAAPDATAEAPTDAATQPTLSTAALDDFVSRQQAIAEDWDQLHDEFDEWTAGLTECHPGAMQGSLTDFTMSFNEVTGAAQGLSRGKTSSELADLLIEAAQEEEAALRQLRDRWQPGNIALFESVAEARANSALAQKEAEDLAIELEDGFLESIDPDALEELQAALDPIITDWQTLHEDYETLVDDAKSLGAAAALKGLEAHVAELEDIADALDELPELSAADDAIDDLKTAVEDEIEAFEDTIEAAEEAAADAEDEEEEEAEDEEDTDADTDDADDADDADSDSDDADSDADSDDADSDADSDDADDADDDDDAESDADDDDNGATAATTTRTVSVRAPPLPDFDDTDDSVADSADAIDEALSDIEELADPDAGQGLTELARFQSEYRDVVTAWDDFHAEYGQWRADDGGCDRGQVAQDLEDFSARTGRLARTVRDLPSGGYLLPIYGLLTDAAAREENALRSLRYTWQPFTLDAFKAVDQQRIRTNDLRRQADIAVQELQHRP